MVHPEKGSKLTLKKKKKPRSFSVNTYFFQILFFSNPNTISQSIHNRIFSFRVFHVMKKPLKEKKDTFDL